MANRESFDQTILEIGSTQSDHSGNQDYQQDEEGRNDNPENSKQNFTPVEMEDGGADGGSMICLSASSHFTVSSLYLMFVVCRSSM